MIGSTSSSLPPSPSSSPFLGKGEDKEGEEGKEEEEGKELEEGKEEEEDEGGIERFFRRKPRRMLPLRTLASARPSP